MSENIYIKKYLENRKRENIEKQKKFLLYKNNPDRDLYQKCQKYSSQNIDGPSTSKYTPPVDNIPSTPILDDKDVLKYSKSITASQQKDNPSTSKYTPPVDNIPSTPILNDKDVLKYSKSINVSEQKKEPKRTNNVTSCIDCKKHVCDCEKYCKFCNISADCINCSMSAHYKICKNKNKIRCKKCSKFYPWKSYQ